jgi:hypothetical protein
MVVYSGTIVVAQPLGVPRHTHMPCGSAPNDPGCGQKDGFAHAAGPDIPGEWGVRSEHGMACRVPDRATCDRSSWEPPLMALLLAHTPRMGLEFRLVPSLPRVLERGGVASQAQIEQERDIGDGGQPHKVVLRLQHGCGSIDCVSPELSCTTIHFRHASWT